MNNLLSLKNLIRLIILLGLINALIFFISNYEGTYDVCLQKEREWKLKELKGRLVSKFVDSSQHNYKTALFIENNDSVKWILDWDESNLFSTLELGDSIYKKQGELEVVILRKSTKSNHLLDFNCEAYK